MNSARRQLLLATLAGFAGSAMGQQYPSRPIRVVLPYGAGGAGDVMLRALCQQMSDSWGQPFIVENKMGANEMIAADFVAKSPGDGYTFLVASESAYSLNPHLYPKVPYDPVNDFVPVAKLVVGNLMLVTRPDFPADSVKQYVDIIKQNPGKFTYASIGAGGTQHLGAAWFNNINGLKMEHIPFKGMPSALPELVSGRVDSMFSVTGAVASYIESGRLKGLAVSGRNRQFSAPKVPTFAEVGYPDFDASFYFGVMAPKGTPPDIVARFSRDMSKIVNTTEFKAKYLQSLGFEPVGDTPEEFAAFMKADRILGAQKVKVSGAKLE